MIVNQQTAGSDWLLLDSDSTCTCSECGNTVTPQVTSVSGMVDADLEEIKLDLQNFPTKILYGICPVCGMEYIFRLVDSKLYLEPSEEEK